MARTRADDYGEKHQLILDTAAEIFAAKGFASASINDISAATGMSKSALYHYHKSKEAILHAILATHVHDLLQAASDATEGVSDPEQRLLRFLEALLGIYATARAKHIVLLNEAALLPEPERREVRTLGRELVRFAIGVLKPLNPAIMERTELRKPYAMMFYGMVNWTYTWYDAAGPIAPAQLAARMTELFLRGFPHCTAGVTHARKPAPV
jgi:AcrR family transcriptional regulator